MAELLIIMANSVIKVVSEPSSEISFTNIKMVDAAESSSSFSNSDVLFARSSCSVETLLKMRADSEGRNFNISLKSSEANTIPKCNPREEQAEIKSKIENASKIDSVRFTRTGSVIFSTKDVTCAINISELTTFLGVNVTPKIIRTITQIAFWFLTSLSTFR